MKRVLFANHAQFEGKYTNLGDWAIFEQMIGRLEEQIADGEIEVIVPSADVAYTNEKYPVRAFRRGGIVGIWNTLKWIVKCDVVVIGGGEIVQDRSSCLYIPYQLIRPFIARIFRKKLFGYAIGVGEEYEISRFGRRLSKYVLNMFDVITVRDEKSYRVLQEYLGVTNPRIYLTADPAINLKASPVTLDDTDNYAIISVRSVFHRNHNLLPFSIRRKLGMLPRKYFEEIEQLKEEIVHLAKEIHRRYGCAIRFLNTYTGPRMSARDDLFTADIVERLSCMMKADIGIIDDSYTPSQKKYVLSKAIFIISIPLHPLILGASENVPVFGLAYASKSASFMAQIAHPEHVFKVEKAGDRLNVDEILLYVDEVLKNNHYRDELKKTMDTLKKEEQKNAELLLELIRR